MTVSPYVQQLRAAVGPALLLMPGVAAIIRDARGWVLCLRRSDDGQWGLPAGAVDPGETPEAAIIREVAEETGLRVVATRIAGIFGGRDFRHRYPNGDEVEYMVAVFECDTLGGEPVAVDGEALELRYFAPDAVPTLGLPYPATLFSADRAGFP